MALRVNPERCESCMWLAQPPEKHPRWGGIIRLDGDNGLWALNHYGGGEGYLGWMALQPVRHVEHLHELNASELGQLGGHLKGIQRGLRAYWDTQFPDDPIERIYVACLMEGLLQYPHPSPHHLHFHVIPRARSVGVLITEHGGDGSHFVNGWRIYTATGCDDFPSEYKPDLLNTGRLLTHLERYLA